MTGEEVRPRALVRALRHIARLDRDLRDLDAPPRSPVAWLTFGLATPAVLGLGALVTLAIVRQPPSPPPTQYYAPPPVAEVVATPPLLGARWYPQPGVTPAVVDVDGDGKQDFLGLAWSNAGGSVYAVAIDGTTFAEKWHAGPYPAIWSQSRARLAVAYDQVLVTDEAGALHALDLASGKELRSITTPKGVEGVCVLPRRASRAPEALLTGSRFDPGANEVLDLSTGALSKAAAGLSCDASPQRPCDPITGVCKTTDDHVRSLARPKTFHGWETYAAYPQEKDGAKVTLGSAYDEDPGPGTRWGVGWKAGAARPSWDHALVAEGDVDHHGRSEEAVDGKHVYYMYQADRDPNLGPYRLVAWSIATGEMSWKTTLPKSAEGSHVSAMGTGGGHVFVVVNQTLHVFDAATGAHQKSIVSL